MFIRVTFFKQQQVNTETSDESTSISFFSLSVRYLSIWWDDHEKNSHSGPDSSVSPQTRCLAHDFLAYNSMFAPRLFTSHLAQIYSSWWKKYLYTVARWTKTYFICLSLDLNTFSPVINPVGNILWSGAPSRGTWSGIWEAAGSPGSHFRLWPVILSALAQPCWQNKYGYLLLCF